MKRFLAFFLFLILGINVHAEEVEEPKELYAQSAVLMDAASGRVLFEKNGFDVKAMASTTKIMTCILALECGEENDVVTFSDYAARQPKVHLGATSNEQFYLKDLLYSLMLESHNDSAVAIAETISGDVPSFARMMNEKAKEIGCKNTYFITPNGLDASDENGTHSTTAADLARIMSYCVLKSPQKERFLEITQTPSYSFTNLKGDRSYSCVNHNSFLNMMSEAISGKTGYTNDAGYCYVGVVESEGRTFSVALLACGWPNNKNYKWSDMKKIVNYALGTFEYETVKLQPKVENVVVLDGIPNSGGIYDEAVVETELLQKEDIVVLKSAEEQVEMLVQQENVIVAPVKAGTQVGIVSYYLKEEKIAEFPIVVSQNVGKKNFRWYFQNVLKEYVLA